MGDRGRGHVMTEAESGLIHPKAIEHQGLLAKPRRWKRQRSFVLYRV